MPDIPPWLASEVYEWLRDPSLAAVIATLSLVVSFKALKEARKDGAKVVGDFEVFEKSDEDPEEMGPILFCITVRNRGRASIDLESFEMIDGDPQENFRWRFYVDDTCTLAKGPRLPVTLRNGAKLTWWYHVSELKLHGLKDESITDPRRIYKALLLPYLKVRFEDGTNVRLYNGNGRGAWMYETLVDWKAKRRELAASSSGDSKRVDDVQPDSTEPRERG